MNWVGFPGLGINKIYLRDYLFKIFGLEVKWYGVILVTGFLLAVIFSMFMAEKFGIKKENLLDIILVGAIFGIIGARVYYVLFNLEEFSKDWLNIFNLRSGGLAIYGVIIFAFTSGFFYCRLKRIPFLPVADVAGISFLLAQSIGRWGNFVNIEAYGVETNSFIRMTSNTFNNAVHPTFLYESLWCFLGFFVLIFLTKYRKFDGQIFLSYIIWYSFERFFVEGIRADSLWLIKNYIRVSQALSFVLFFLAVFTYLYVLFFYMKNNKDKEFLYVNLVNRKENFKG